MRAGEKRLSGVLKSRGATWLMLMCGFAMGVFAFLHGESAPDDASDAMWLPSPGSWITDPLGEAVAGMGICLCVAVLLWSINKVYNLLRTVSPLFVGVFILSMASTPAVMTNLTSGGVLAAGVLAGILLMFSVYQSPELTRRVFLIFFILGCGAVCDYPFIPFMVVFLVGCSQMRALTLRTLLAALGGILTPLWLLWAFGLIDLRDFAVPLPSIDIEALTAARNVPSLVCVGVTMLAGLVFGTAALVRFISFNARSRAYFGLVSLTGIVSGTLCVADFGNVYAYVPLLDACTAVQAGLFMRLYENRRAYIAVLSLIAAYVCLYLWSMIA